VDQWQRDGGVPYRKCSKQLVQPRLGDGNVEFRHFEVTQFNLLHSTMTDADTFESTVQRVLADQVTASAHTNTVGPNNGSTALVMVCTQGRATAARALVEVGGAAVDLEAWSFSAEGAHAGNASEDVGGWKRRRTPLMAAAQNGHTDVVWTLLELGARVNQGKSDDGGTAP
jgi:ankyrin repeat protein